MLSSNKHIGRSLAQGTTFGLWRLLTELAQWRRAILAEGQFCFAIRRLAKIKSSVSIRCICKYPGLGGQYRNRPGKIGRDSRAHEE